MSTLPSGPLPADYIEAMAKIIREVGVRALTKSVIRQRLESLYKIEFTSHAAQLQEDLKKVLQRDEFQRELVKAQKEEEERIGGKGKKRTRSETTKKSSGTGKEKEKSARKEKKPDDYPKPALSGFMHFGNAKREEIRAANPALKITEISKQIGELWAKCTPSEKEHFAKLAEKDKARFERDMAAYKQRGGSVISRGGKVKKEKKAKDPNAPKRALSAYFFFSGDFRQKHPNLKVTEQMQQAGAAWKAMSDAEKQPYVAKAEKDKERYERERAGN